MADTPRGTSAGQKLICQLRNPWKLRAGVTALLLTGWYSSIYAFRSATIVDVNQRIVREQKRLRLAKDIESLREQVARYGGKLPIKADQNEWAQYLLAEIRDRPLQLVSLNLDKPQDVGPYRAAVLKLEIQGQFLGINDFLHWLEENPRMIRLDSVHIDRVLFNGGTSDLKLQVTALGLMSAQP